MLPPLGKSTALVHECGGTPLSTLECLEVRDSPIVSCGGADTCLVGVGVGMRVCVREEQP